MGRLCVKYCMFLSLWWWQSGTTLCFMLRLATFFSSGGLGSSPTAWYNKLKFLEHALNAYLLLVDGNILTFFFMTSHILGAPPSPPPHPPPGVTEPSPPL